MSTKLEYLKKCVQANTVLGSKRWYISCFAIPILKDEVYDVTTKTQYSMVTKSDGLYYLDYDETSQLVPVRILDYVKNQPLFDFQTLIEADSSWVPSITGKILTKIGVMVVNALVLYPTLGKKVDYINSKISVKMVESILFEKVRNDDVATDKDVRVKEMVECLDRLTFLSSLAIIISIASTPKAITPPPGLAKIKKELLEEYKDQMDNPIKVVELEAKLIKIDNDYLADDPTANNIFNKKSKKARKKMYLMVGETADFIATKENKVVTGSLSEGLSTDPEIFALYMNDLRSGSYDRGASTALAGYGYKILQRSISGITISGKACNTTRGFKRLIDKDNYKKLVSRYVKEKGWKLIDSLEAAKGYIGKETETRSPMFCTTGGNMVCYACMSESYKDNPSGVTNLAASISGSLLTIFLQAIHGTVTETTPIQMADLVT